MKDIHEMQMLIKFYSSPASSRIKKNKETNIRLPRILFNSFFIELWGGKQNENISPGWRNGKFDSRVSRGRHIPQFFFLVGIRTKIKEASDDRCECVCKCVGIESE